MFHDFLVSLAVLILPAVVGQTTQPGATESTTLDINIDEPRPLAAAAELLEHRHGVVITYEDPIYRNASDLSDVTLKVRKDLDKYEPGKAPKVLIPRSAPIQINYVASAKNTIDVPAILDRLLKAHAEQGNPGVFELAQTDGIYHIIPRAVKGMDGKLTKTGSILDAKISFSEQERTGLETLEIIEEEVRKGASPEVKKITGGMAPLNLMSQGNVRMGASQETARTVLARLMEQFKYKLSWQLFYDPGLKWYALNIHVALRIPASAPAR